MTQRVKHRPGLLRRVHQPSAPRGSSAPATRRKALLRANLENTAELKKLELDADFTARLALTEEDKTLPFGAIWDYYCLKEGVPVGEDWLKEVRDYEKNVISARG